MREADAFGTYHPAINFAFFIGAVVFAACFRHPLYAACAVIFSALYYLTIHGAKGLKMVAGMVPVFIVLSAINPLFNTMGDTVLFTYFAGRPYTLEALFYGMAIAAMLVAMLLWFGGYNAVMTSDKFTYLFGAVAPSISLVFTMVLRLVPNYQRKLAEFSTARSCVGLAGDSGTKLERIEHGTGLISALTSWALENGVVTADSMRSRGYGCGARSSFARYRFIARDKLLLFALVALAIATVVPAFFGSAAVEYIPAFVVPAASPLGAFGIFAYAVFLAVPSVINIRESLLWRISLSRI